MHSLRIAALLLIVAYREVNSFSWPPPPIVLGLPLGSPTDKIVEIVLGQLKRVTEAVNLLEKYSDKLCLKEEMEPVKKYIESRKAMVDFLIKFAEDPKKYINMKSKCVTDLLGIHFPFPLPRL
ncbi:hypothetical protein Aduo_019714 [Ancylostoma duodenale]